MLLFVILLWAVCQLIWALFQGARGDMFQVRVVISLFGAAYGRKKPKPVQTSVSGWALRPENHKPVYGKHASNWIKAKQTAVLDLKTWQECRHWHRVRNIHNTAKARARVSNRLIVVWPPTAIDIDFTDIYCNYLRDCDLKLECMSEYHPAERTWQKWNTIFMFWFEYNWMKIGIVVLVPFLST